MFDELVAREVQSPEHGFFVQRLVHPISSFPESSEVSFAHAIIYCIFYPTLSCNCLSLFFTVAHEFPEGRDNF